MVKKSRKKTSVIWSIDRNILSDIVKKSDSLSAILRHFGLVNKGGNSHTLERRLIEENIVFSHIRLGSNSNIGRKFNVPKKTLSEVMVKDSTYSRRYLKKRLIEENIILYRCDMCGSQPAHNGKELILVLDHVNGISDDNRKDNLRFLCPNCNSQTETFAGRNKKRKREKYYCESCGKQKKTKNSDFCTVCAGKKRRKVKNRPSIEELKKQIKDIGYSALGRKYCVSDKAIKKWLKDK